MYSFWFSSSYIKRRRHSSSHCCDHARTPWLTLGLLLALDFVDGHYLLDSRLAGHCSTFSLPTTSSTAPTAPSYLSIASIGPADPAFPR